MTELLVLRKRLQKLYAKKSLLIDKFVQFLVALVAIWVINHNIGVMEILLSPVVVLGVVVVCTILPPVFTVVFIALIVCAHMFEVSMGIAMVSAAIFLIMFAFYCHFTPKKSQIIMLTALAGCLHAPYIVVIAVGLLFSPVASIPVVFGLISYYMIAFVKNSVSAIASADGIMSQITLFVKAIFQNKEMLVACLTAVICICVVYAIRRMAMDYAWTIAAAAGALINVIVYVAGAISLNLDISYGSLIIGNVIAVGVGLVLQFFFFSVDYSRTESLQFEDDEYYYYVKAVPKLSVSEPEKVVKRINERKKDLEEKSTEQILLEKSLQDELEIQNIIDKEFEQ